MFKFSCVKTKTLLNIALNIDQDMLLNQDSKLSADELEKYKEKVLKEMAEQKKKEIEKVGTISHSTL